MSDDALIAKFDELIAATRAASLPVRERWLDAEAAAALLSITPSTFVRHYACRPDFPKPLRVGHPRWKAAEVLQWAEDRRKAA